MLFVRRKQKIASPSKCPSTACRPWNEFLVVVVQSGLCAAPMLCLDERCVLMKAVWEFNEARWDWAWSYGNLLMWNVLRGFLLLCLYELDTFYGILPHGPFTFLTNGITWFVFSKDCTLVELPATLNWTALPTSFDQKDHATGNNNLKMSLSDDTVAP